MKRIRWGRVVIALLLLMLLFGCIERDWRNREERSLLADLQAAQAVLQGQPDFTRMQPAGDSVCLTLVDGTEQLVPMPEGFMAMFDRMWLHPFRLCGGWKCGDDVYFITGGAVDDCWGYVLSGDAVIGTEGLNTLRRVGGSAWYFSTMAE